MFFCRLLRERMGYVKQEEREFYLLKLLGIRHQERDVYPLAIKFCGVRSILAPCSTRCVSHFRPMRSWVNLGNCEGNIIELPYPGSQLFGMLFGVTFLKCWISTILQTNTSMNRSNTKTVPIFDKKHTHDWLFINGGLLINYCTHTSTHTWLVMECSWV